jgi:hypothetical protein
VGGAVTLTGPEKDHFGWLAGALDVPADEEVTQRDVHGFHSYPARMHPVTAERLVRGLARPFDLVLDPFCGSGTVLVEARPLGCRTAGVDANPLAVALSMLKLRGVRDDERTRLQTEATRAADAADGRRAARAGATKRYGPEDVALFDPHVLLELDGVRASIDSVRDTGVRRALLLVLSSILTKVSKSRGDTGRELVEKRLASGYTIRLFRAKVEDLCRRLAAYEKRLGEGAEAAGLAAPCPFDIRLGDARNLGFLAPASVRAVITSPPYPGTYDYLAHHADRLRWLRMDARALEKAEIGARRHLETMPPPAAAARYASEIALALEAMARVLARDGAIALLIADSAVGGRAVQADEVVGGVAAAAGLRVAAVASQERAHFHRASAHAFAAQPRREHVIVLCPSPRRDDPGVRTGRTGGSFARARSR